MLPRFTLLITSAFACLCLTETAVGQSQTYDVRPDAAQVKGEFLQQSFKGITHEGAYNFDARGRPGVRFSERHYADGRIVYTENGESFKGHWAITPGNTICYSYEEKMAGGGGCFRVYKLGSCYYFYSSYYVEREDEIDRDYWTARSVKKGERATCEDMIS